MNDTPSEGGGKIRGGSALLLLVLLFGALSMLCHQAYKPHDIMWANDTQLGPLKATSGRAADLYTGHWCDHWWIGTDDPNNSPSLSNLLGTVFSPETFLKIFTPLTMLILGFSAWLFFRQMKFAPIVCAVGGLAAGLNMHCFSVACWGLGSWNMCIAMIFLALAALVTDSIRQTWCKAILAGLAVGMAVMEGFDSGAILSVYIAVFIVFLCWIEKTSMAKRLVNTLKVEVLVVAFAGLIAASTIYALVGTQIIGITRTAQTTEVKKSNWDFATEWSLPKLETLRLIIPGVFGYRLQEYMTTQDKSAAYWGRVGEDPLIAKLESSDPQVRADAAAASIGDPRVVEAMRSDNATAHTEILDQVKAQRQRRHSGNGEYAGVLVALFAIFALLNSARGAGSSPYTKRERLMVWFWGLAALFSLVAAWGRFSFLYAILYYNLPYLSTIRNPIKFLHAFHITWLVLAGFGLEAFYRCYLRRTDQATPVTRALQTKSWWQKLPVFDKAFFIGLPVVVCACVAGYFAYAGSLKDLTDYIARQGFPTELSGGIAAFSVHEVALFVILLLISTGVMLSAVAGAWKGRWVCGVWAALCVIMIFDLSHADRPWVRYFDYDEKYSMNDITKFLMDKPYEHRVVGRLSPQGGYDLPGDGNFAAIIHWWLENDFPAHDIQSLEIDQMPRTPELENNFLGYLSTPSGGAPSIFLTSRLWKLTNTRYVFAAAQFMPALNQLDPAHPAFRFVNRFNLVPKPSIKGLADVEDAGDLTPQISPEGASALLEYNGALPRAKLYANWRSFTNDQTVLQTLGSTNWDPDTSVLISQTTNDSAAPAPGPNPSADPGTANITDYRPKDIQLKATAKTPAVLLYNDRIAAEWHVWVDGKPAPLLRCNYIMRGVFLPPGEHAVEFKFQPSIATLYVTLAAWAVGILLGAYLIWDHFARKTSVKTT